MDANVLRKISYGMFIVSSIKEQKFNGQIANTVFQITSEPSTLAVSINKQNLTYEYIKQSKVFSVSILNKNAPIELIQHFGFRSGRTFDKFNDQAFKIDFKFGITKAPIVLNSTIGYLEAEVIKIIDVGTHSVFVGRIVAAELLKEEEPMTYSYYHEIKKGKTPKTAPTFIDEKSIQEGNIANKYICKVCGYVYDPEIGDPENNIKSGTPFEQLPDSWVCPVCGAEKNQFEKMS